MITRSSVTHFSRKSQRKSKHMRLLLPKLKYSFEKMHILQNEEHFCTSLNIFKCPFYESHAELRKEVEAESTSWSLGWMGRALPTEIDKVI